VAAPGRARKSTPISPPALDGLNPISVVTLARCPVGSRSSTLWRRRWGSSAMVSAASSAHIRASTAAISVSVRAPSSLLARSSSSSSSGSAWTWLRISVPSDADASMCRADILADPALPVGEICLRWGLPDSSHIARQFRQQFGMSPQQVRAQALSRADADAAELEPPAG
jgi:AraC-like DNA-binding protein